MILALFASAAMQAGPVYTVEVMVQDKQGLFRSSTVRIERTIRLEEGEFEIARKEGPLLKGEIEIDGREVTVEMVICRPQVSPCDVIGEPRVSFRIGDEAEVSARNLRTNYDVRFEPE